MAQVPVRKQVTVRIKRGERIILPSDARIISVTEVDGANATSLCTLPEPTGTKKLTYFFERRLDYNPIGNNNDLDVWVTNFTMGDNIGWFVSGIKQDDNLVNSAFFKDVLYSIPGVIKVFICSDCAGSGCNNTITLEIPEDTPDPYFTFNFDEGSADPWYTRVYPIDPNFPGQPPRAECGNLIPR